MKYKVGDEVKFYYNGIVCNGIVMSADKEIYTVNFAYRESGIATEAYKHIQKQSKMFKTNLYKYIVV